jgi:molybdopterin molybdotransferase
VEEAMAMMLSAVSPVSERETLSLTDALDRILAEPVRASVDVPGHDNSGMDGYALCIRGEAPAGRRFRIVGRSFAGHPFEGTLAPGEAVRIMTGAVVPEGADAVVMQEHTKVDNDEVVLQRDVRLGDHIRKAGEDIRAGEEVLQAGIRLGPVALGVAASMGAAHVKVFRRLKVALLATGDELTRPGEPLPVGGIYESNSVVVGAMLRRLGCEVRDMGIIPDDREALGDAFAQADDWADVVISSGGVSVGEADYTKELLESMGQITFWKLAIKPGKPFAFGQLPNSLFIGLPGNPVSATVTMHQLAVPVLRRMQGEVLQEQQAQHLPRAVLTTSLRKKPGRRDYQRGRLTVDENGRWQVASVGAQGSGILTSLHRANCYMVLPEEAEHPQAGERVTVLPFDRWLV